MSEKQESKSLTDYIDKYKGITDAFFASESVPSYHKTVIVLHVVTILGIISILLFTNGDKIVPIIGVSVLSCIISVLLMVRENS